ncbi:MAG: hypothetical protein ACOCUY_01630 [Verrucomicrobiota bacterium]
MPGPELQAWEKKLRTALAAVDRMLEQRYGDRFPLRPNRPSAGETASFAADGLFAVGAKYTAGFGSATGEGYIVEIRMSTFAGVPSEWRETVRDEAAKLLRTQLAEVFPDRDLEVSREGAVLKIHGDLGL